MNLTHTGNFSIGLVVDGTRHTAFELQPATVGDNVEAIEEQGDAQPLVISAAVYARQLVSLGTLDRKAITTKLLLQLNPADWAALEEANAELKKKLLAAGQPLRGGTPAASSASAMA